MRRYLLHLSYFGNRYRLDLNVNNVDIAFCKDEICSTPIKLPGKMGFQKQNIDGSSFYDDPHTVCGLLEIALKGCRPSNHPIVVPSSRTDKGVHALCNTVHVDLDCERRLSEKSITFELNHFFDFNDHDIRILKTQQVANDFHCRHAAYERRYLYRLAVPRAGVNLYSLLTPFPITESKRCYFVPDSNFDLEAVKAACNIFVGYKDFGALCSKSKNRNAKERISLRDIHSFELVPASPLMRSSQLAEQYDFYHFICVGKSFLYHQVRRMVSALITYGQGKVSLADIQQLMDKPVPSSWNAVYQMVPSYGLYLVDVLYHAEDLALPEELSEEVVNARKLEEEHDQLLQDLKNFSGNISEKIDLRQRLLKIKKIQAAR